MFFRNSCSVFAIIEYDVQWGIQNSKEVTWKMCVLLETLLSIYFYAEKKAPSVSVLLKNRLSFIMYFWLANRWLLLLWTPLQRNAEFDILQTDGARYLPKLLRAELHGIVQKRQPPRPYVYFLAFTPSWKVKAWASVLN